MKPRSLLILALLVVGVGAFVWFGRELPSSDERVQRAKRVVLVEADQVSSLEIEWDGQVVALERSATAPLEEDVEPGVGEWLLTRPIEARADSQMVDGIISRLVVLEKERTLAGVAPADVGLAQPRGRVRLVTDSARHVFAVGAEIPASSNMTLAVEGEDGVHVVSAAIWGDLTREPSEWRDKNLFAGGRGEIERLALGGDGVQVLLAKHGDDFWIESPVVDRADETHVNSLLSTITGLRAERFLEESEATQLETGLESPRATVEVMLTGAASPLRVALGNPESEEEGAAFFVSVDGQVVTSKAVLAEHAERSPEQWRSKELVAGEVYELERVEIEDALSTVELRRVEGDWLRDGEPIDFGSATDLLYEISGGSAERVVDASTLGELGAPRLTFRLVAEATGGESAETLELFEPIVEETPARVSNREGVLMLSAETAGRIADKLAALRTAAVVPPEDDADAASEG